MNPVASGASPLALLMPAAAEAGAATASEEGAVPATGFADLLAATASAATAASAANAAAGGTAAHPAAREARAADEEAQQAPAADGGLLTTLLMMLAPPAFQPIGDAVVSQGAAGQAPDAATPAGGPAMPPAAVPPSDGRPAGGPALPPATMPPRGASPAANAPLAPPEAPGVGVRVVPAVPAPESDARLPVVQAALPAVAAAPDVVAASAWALAPGSDLDPKRTTAATAPAPVAVSAGTAAASVAAHALPPALEHVAVDPAAQASPGTEPAPRLDREELAEALAARLSWQAHHQVGRAEIRVSPPELGTIEIDIQLDGRELRAEFNAASPEVRQALEAGLPRLRELLDAQGLTLAHAGVGGQGARPDTPSTPPAPTVFGARADGGPAEATTVVTRRGLLDEYA